MYSEDGLESKMSKPFVSEIQSEKLMNARCRLMTREPWYGHIAMSMEWIPSQMSWIPNEQARTMGVRIVGGGRVQCLFYPPFVETLSLKELFAVIQHEIEHIVRVHCIRVGGREPQAWNIAADMTVNGRRSQPRIGYKESATSETVVPMKGKIIWIPDDWKHDETSEFYYDQLQKRQKGPTCPKCNRPVKGQNQGQQDTGGKGGKKGKDKSGQGQGQGQEKGQNGQGGGQGEHQHGQNQGQGEGCCSSCGQEEDGTYDYGGVQGKAIDDHSTWNQSDVSQDEARQIVKDIVDQATQKCQGQVPGHLEDAIKDLAKPKVRWRELLRQYLGKHVGNRRSTWSRRHRRYDAFGIKGISHHAAATVTVIVDTSGSIGKKELEQFFAEIDAISSRAQVFVLQWDHAFQGYGGYRRGDWKRYKINGRGGTDMAQPVQWIMDQRAVSDVTVMLTDGYANWLSPEKVQFPFITVITTPEGTTDGPKYGHQVRMKVAE
jgi:predicted metal-dependent peptidase